MLINSHAKWFSEVQNIFFSLMFHRMHPKDISIKNYSYSLPDDRIANFPLPERDASKLLIFKDGQIVEDVYRNITDYLPRNSLLVFNNTKVIQARILFQKSSGWHYRDLLPGAL